MKALRGSKLLFAETSDACRECRQSCHLSHGPAQDTVIPYRVIPEVMSIHIHPYFICA